MPPVEVFLVSAATPWDANMDAEEWKTQPAWIRIRIRFRIRAGGKQLHGVSSSSAQMVVVMVGQ